jgi:hypothetical protein
MDQINMDQKYMEQQYIQQLSSMEKLVLKIAQEHLETSFCLKESIGYKEWLKNNTNTKGKL